MKPSDEDLSPAQKRHLSAIESIMERESLVLSPRQMVYLFAHLQANTLFQQQAIRSVASAASGKMEWDLVDSMVETAETAQAILDRFIFEVAGE